MFSISLFLFTCALRLRFSRGETLSCNAQLDVNRVCGPCTGTGPCNFVCSAFEDICVESIFQCQSGTACQVDCNVWGACLESFVEAQSATALTMNCDSYTSCEKAQVTVGVGTDVVLNCGGTENTCKDLTLNGLYAGDVAVNCNGYRSCVGMNLLTTSANNVLINCNEADGVCASLTLHCGTGHCRIDCSGGSNKCGSIQVVTGTAVSFKCIGTAEECKSAPLNYGPPTMPPSVPPTTSPTKSPVEGPTSPPSNIPTRLPTSTPTSTPSASPTTTTTRRPTGLPTSMPTKVTPAPSTSTLQPTTRTPSTMPSNPPLTNVVVSSAKPTLAPSQTASIPSKSPSLSPTQLTRISTLMPTQTQTPTQRPSVVVPSNTGVIGVNSQAPSSAPSSVADDMLLESTWMTPSPTTLPPTSDQEDAEICCECAEASMGQTGCTKDKECSDKICDIDPYCCESQWDNTCAYYASDQCAKTKQAPNPSNMGTEESPTDLDLIWKFALVVFAVTVLIVSCCIILLRIRRMCKNCRARRLQKQKSLSARKVKVRRVSSGPKTLAAPIASLSVSNCHVPLDGARGGGGRGGRGGTHKRLDDESTSDDHNERAAIIERGMTEPAFQRVPSSTAHTQSRPGSGSNNNNSTPFVRYYSLNNPYFSQPPPSDAHGMNPFGFMSVPPDFMSGKNQSVHADYATQQQQLNMMHLFNMNLLASMKSTGAAGVAGAAGAGAGVGAGYDPHHTVDVYDQHQQQDRDLIDNIISGQQPDRDDEDSLSMSGDHDVKLFIGGGQSIGQGSTPQKNTVQTNSRHTTETSVADRDEETDDDEFGPDVDAHDLPAEEDEEEEEDAGQPFPNEAETQQLNPKSRKHNRDSVGDDGTVSDDPLSEMMRGLKRLQSVKQQST